MCVHLQKQEISSHSSCRRARTHCYWWGRGLRHTTMVNTMADLDVRPTWGWVSVAKNATVRWWALEIACKDTMWVIVLGQCENARGAMTLWLHYHYLRVGRDRFFCNDKMKQQINTVHLVVGNKNPAPSPCEDHYVSSVPLFLQLHRNLKGEKSQVWHMLKQIDMVLVHSVWMY